MSLTEGLVLPLRRQVRKRDFVSYMWRGVVLAHGAPRVLL